MACLFGGCFHIGDLGGLNIGGGGGNAKEGDYRRLPAVPAPQVASGRPIQASENAPVSDGVAGVAQRAGVTPSPAYSAKELENANKTYFLFCFFAGACFELAAALLVHSGGAIFSNPVTAGVFGGLVLLGIIFAVLAHFALKQVHEIERGNGMEPNVGCDRFWGTFCAIVGPIAAAIILAMCL